MEANSKIEREIPEGFISTIKLLLEDLKNTKQFSDVVLISSDNCKFDCHKLILALSSPILRNTFQDLRDEEDLIVFLPFAHSSLVSKVLDILYTGDAKVNGNECADIWEVFDHLEITKNFVNIFEEYETTVDKYSMVPDDNFQTLHIVEDESIEDVKDHSIKGQAQSVLLGVVDINTVEKEVSTIVVEEPKKEQSNVRFFCTFENCGKSYSRNPDLVAHNRLHTGERPYACQFCESRYTSAMELRRHMLKIHNQGERVACTRCGKTFRDSNNLKTHMSVHTGEKPFKCELCPSTFSQKNDLVKHGRIHSTIEPFKCDTCEMTFKWKHTLKRHLLTHTGEKKFKCDYCDLKFRQNFDLNKHKRIHTGEKNYCCKFCEKRFSRQDYLAKHLLTHDKQRSFQCPVPSCDLILQSDVELKKHFKIHSRGDLHVLSQDVEIDGVKEGAFTIVDGEFVTVMDCDGDTFLVSNAGDAFAFQTQVELPEKTTAFSEASSQPLKSPRFINPDNEPINK